MLQVPLTPRILAPEMMVIREKHSPALRAGAVFLAALWTAVLLVSAVHTDDGCRVEVHCVACLWALSSSADAAAEPLQVPDPGAAGPALPDGAAAETFTPAPASNPRAPPAL